VQTGADVRLIRQTLDDAGGHHVKIISKIENAEGVANIDDILMVGAYTTRDTCLPRHHTRLNPR
jgi:pyruvate kinase